MNSQHILLVVGFLLIFRWRNVPTLRNKVGQGNGRLIVVFASAPAEIVAGKFSELHPKTEDNWRFAFLDCWFNGAVMSESFAAAWRAFGTYPPKRELTIEHTSVSRHVACVRSSVPASGQLFRTRPLPAHEHCRF
jgi:hypothetical protein